MKSCTHCHKDTMETSNVFSCSRWHYKISDWCFHRCFHHVDIFGSLRIKVTVNVFKWMNDPWIHALNTWHITHDEYNSQNIAKTKSLKVWYIPHLLLHIIPPLNILLQSRPHGLVVRVKALIPGTTWFKSLYGHLFFHWQDRDVGLMV